MSEIFYFGTDSVCPTYKHIEIKPNDKNKIYKLKRVLF